MLFRRLLGAAAVYDKLLVLPSVGDFYCGTLYPLDQVHDPLRGIVFSPYHWHDGCSPAWGIHGGELVLALLLMAGRGNDPLLSAALWMARTWNWRRMPTIVTGGDTLLSIAMLASALLPMRAVISTEPAVILLRLQMCLVYLVSVLNKLLLEVKPGRERYDWIGGGAISQVLRCRKDITVVGEWLTTWPQLCRMLTWTTLAVQGFACVALLCPGRVGTTALVAVALMHIGMALTMRLYNYTPTVFTALSIFVSTRTKKRKRDPEEWYARERREAAVLITGMLLLMTMHTVADTHRAGWPVVQARGDDWLTAVTEMVMMRGGEWSAGTYRCAYFAVPAQLREGGSWVDLHRVRHAPGEMPHWQPNVTRPSTHPTHMLWEAAGVYDPWRCELSAAFYCHEYPMVHRVSIVAFPDAGAPGTEICDQTCPSPSSRRPRSSPSAPATSQ